MGAYEFKVKLRNGKSILEPIKQIKDTSNCCNAGIKTGICLSCFEHCISTREERDLERKESNNGLSKKLIDGIRYNKPYIVPKLKKGQEEKFNQVLEEFVGELDNLYKEQ